MPELCDRTPPSPQSGHSGRGRATRPTPVPPEGAQASPSLRPALGTAPGPLGSRGQGAGTASGLGSGVRDSKAPTCLLSLYCTFTTLRRPHKTWPGQRLCPRGRGHTRHRGPAAVERSDWSLRRSEPPGVRGHGPRVRPGPGRRSSSQFGSRERGAVWAAWRALCLRPVWTKVVTGLPLDTGRRPPPGLFWSRKRVRRVLLDPRPRPGAARPPGGPGCAAGACPPWRLAGRRLAVTTSGRSLCAGGPGRPPPRWAARPCPRSL